MKFRIPYLSSREQAQPLNDVIDFAARRSGLDDYRVTRVLTFLLEGIADQVSLGRTVRLPGFGVFAAFLDERRQYRGHRSGPVCHPKFSASKGFRAQVMSTAPCSRTGKSELATHRRNHSVSPHRYSTRRVFTSMGFIREEIARQLGVEPECESPVTDFRE